MKLIGSIAEQEYRKWLIYSHQWLLGSFAIPPGERGAGLINVLKAHYPQMVTAYVISSIPEQGEDHYKVLINDELIVNVEISHDSLVAPIVDSITVKQYLHKLSKTNQIQLAVALDLVKNDLAGNKLKDHR